MNEILYVEIQVFLTEIFRDEGESFERRLRASELLGILQGDPPCPAPENHRVAHWNPAHH